LDVEGLAERSERLLSHMRDVGYSEGYVDQVAREVRWLARNGGRYKDFGEACAAREAESGSEVTRKSRRVSMGIVAAFETSGELPEFGRSSPLRSRSSYSRLLPGMAGVVDAYLSHARAAGVSDGTAAHYASVASSFLLDMQFRGRGSLAEVTEEDDFDATWMRSDEAMEGLLFLNHLSATIATEIQEIIYNSGHARGTSYKDCMELAKQMRACQYADGSWQAVPAIKKRQDLCDDLGLDPYDLSLLEMDPL